VIAIVAAACVRPTTFGTGTAVTGLAASDGLLGALEPTLLVATTVNV
jgi:hypothetical protein